MPRSRSRSRSRSRGRRSRSRSRSRSRRDRERDERGSREKEEGEVKKERRRKSRFDDGPPIGSKWDQTPPSGAPVAASFLPTNYQTITTKTIAVPMTVVGSLIGKGGSVISQLMQQSGGCKIQMQQKDDMAPDARQRGVNLTGTLAQIAEAERLVNAVVAQVLAGGVSQGNTTIAVPSSSVGSIIGRSGAVIKKLIEDTGCQIKILPNDLQREGRIERDVSLIGNSSQVAHATKLIFDIVADPSSTGLAPGGFNGSAAAFRPQFPAGVVKKAVVVRDTDVGSLIGHKGSVIKQLIADSGCHIQIQPKNETGPPTLTREVLLSGTADQVEKAARLIADLTASNPSAPPGLSQGPMASGNVYNPYGPPMPSAPYNPYAWPPPAGPALPPGLPPGWQPPPFNPYGIPGLATDSETRPDDSS